MVPEDEAGTRPVSRRDELNALAIEEFGRKKLDLHRMVARLKALFEADACSIFLEGPGEEVLRLGSSTDPLLLGEEREVIYLKGESLTGWVYRHGEPLLINRADDRSHVESILDQRREGPKFPEHNSRGEIAHRFLGVPIRGGRRTIGALRITRGLDEPELLPVHQKDLCAFADLLGIALRRTWDLLLLETLQQSTSIALAVTRRESQTDGSYRPRLVSANPGARELLGYAIGESIEADVSNLYDSTDYSQLRADLEPKLETAMRLGRSEHGPVDLRLLHKNGSKRWVRISFRILADQRVQPPTIYTIGIFRDQTEAVTLADQHRRLTNMLASLGIAFFRADFAGRTLETSKAESQILGYSESELRQLDRHRLFADDNERDALVEEVRQKSGKLHHARRYLKRKDGKQICVEGNIRVVKDAFDGGLSIEGLYQDVTQRLQLQDFVEAGTDKVLLDDELLEKLLENERRHHDYLSSLGHQLLTPLTSLVETLSNLEEDLAKDAAYASKRLRWVTAQTKQCMRMVRNLSYMDKILRKQPFKHRKVDLGKLCIDTKLDFDHMLDEHSLKLDFDATNISQLVPVRGHEDMLRQVLVNLIDNAIKYSVPRSKITIRAFHWPRGRGLEIRNRGLPIPQELREEVFKRGVRTKRAEAMVPWGTGLGLWLVKRILEAHDATIECDEIRIEKKRWTCFRMTFPDRPRSHQ